MFRFCTLLSPKLRGLDKNEQRNIYFCPVFATFALIRYTFALVERRRTQGVERLKESKTQGAESKRMPEVAGLWKSPDANKCLFAIWRACKKGYPPPFGERQEPSTPIIFRTKNPEKSRLGKIRKNFGKNLRENVSG